MENKKVPVLCDALECTGCSACSNICPKDAIQMASDADGFVRPVVNENECIGCLACEKSCPVLNKPDTKNNAEQPTVFACWNNDAETRKVSSSGGAFSALARNVIEQGGYVVGASYDENMKVCHTLCNSLEDIEKLRGSKYVQSEIGFVFRNIKSHLSEGKTVLFVGTPCQVAGLRAFLKKDYPNLFCCDFICHGTPSPLLFKKYLEWVESKKKIKVTNFNFRHKKSGWYDAVRMANEDVCMNGAFDAYFFGFNRNITLRESCYRCPAIGLPRNGDLTIADFWGIGMKYKFDKIDEIPNGVSLVMINNEKGLSLFEDAKKYLYWQPGRFDEALSRNKPMITPSSRPQLRDSFYQDMEQMDFDELREKYFTIFGKAKLIASFREFAPRQCVIGFRKIIQFLTWKKNGSKSL